MLGHGFDLPIKIITTIDMTQYYILTRPEYNRTEAEVHSDLEESILVMSPGVASFYIVLFALTHIFIVTICHRLFAHAQKPEFATTQDLKKRLQEVQAQRCQLRAKIRQLKTDRQHLKTDGQKLKEGQELKTDDLPLKTDGLHLKTDGLHLKTDGLQTSQKRTKVSGNKVTWEMARHIFKQGSRVKFGSVTQGFFFFLFECSVGMLIVFLLNFMSAELVVYKKPQLLNTLMEVWNARDKYNISFVEASGAPGIFANSKPGSLKRKLWEESTVQWDRIVAKGQENLRLLPSASMMTGFKKIEEYNMALLSSYLPIGILIGLECAQDLKEEGSSLYSNMYKSKESFMLENMVQVKMKFLISLLIN